MCYLKKLKKEERGSATIEFLSMLPLLLFFTLVLFQFIIVGYNIIVTQSALNEASKVYSTTGNYEMAKAVAQDILSTSGNNIIYKDFFINGNTDFSVSLAVELDLIFVPDNVVGIGNLSTIPFEKSIQSRVIE